MWPNPFILHLVQYHNEEKLRSINNSESNEKNNILPCNMLRERATTFFTNNWIISSLETNNFFSLLLVNLRKFKNFQIWIFKTCFLWN